MLNQNVACPLFAAVGTVASQIR